MLEDKSTGCYQEAKQNVNLRYISYPATTACVHTPNPKIAHPLSYLAFTVEYVCT